MLLTKLCDKLHNNKNIYHQSNKSQRIAYNFCKRKKRKNCIKKKKKVIRVLGSELEFNYKEISLTLLLFLGRFVEMVTTLRNDFSDFFGISYSMRENVKQIS